MSEAYRVGVSIALSGDIAKVIGKVIAEFERLDGAVNKTKENISGLKGALSGLATEGKAAADAWASVAKSISAASAAATKAAAASAGMQPRQANARGNATSEAQAAINAANAANAAQRSAPNDPRAVVPYTGGAYTQSRGRYGDQGSGPTIDLPYRSSGTGMVPYPGAPLSRIYSNESNVLEGEILSPEEYARLGGGRGLQTGPTINGTASGSGYTNYGPRSWAGMGSGAWYAGGGQPVGGQTNGGGIGWGGGGGGGGPPGPRGSVPPFQPQPPFQNPWGPTPPASGGGRTGGLDTMAGIPAWLGGEYLKKIVEEAAAFDEEAAKQLSLGLTPDEVKKAKQNALNIQQENMGVTYPGALHLQTMLMGVTQDKKIALDPQVLEEYARLGTVLQKYGKGDEVHELDQAIRGAEFRGVLLHKNKETGEEEVDREALSRLLKVYEAATVITGGAVSPHNLTQFLRSSGTAGALISEEELLRQVSLQIALGTSKAGSNLQAWNQQFVAGRESEAAAKLMAKWKIIAGGDDLKTNPYIQKMGVGQFMLLAGAMDPEATQLAFTDPSKFTMEHLLPKFKQHLTEVYGDAYTKGDDKTKMAYETAEASRLASRIGGGVEMAEFIRNQPLMERDLAAAMQAMLRNVFAIHQENNPETNIKSVVAANQAFQIQLGEQAMPMATQAMNNFSKALNDLSNWATEHSTATTIALTAFTGAIVALGVGAVVAALGTFSGMTGVIVGLGAAAAVTIEGIKNLDEWLRKAFPHVFTSDEEQAKFRKSMDEHGTVYPWWMPLPLFGNNQREERPDWAKPFDLMKRLFPDANAPGSDAAAPGPRQPMAPTSSTMDTGPKGTDPDPIVVVVKNQISGSDIARGVGKNMASVMNRPPSGVTGSDLRIDPLAGFYNGVTP